MSRRVRILLGGILLALMSAYVGVYVYSLSLPKKGSYAGFSASWDGKGEPRITGVDPNLLAADFQVGDELMAIDGVKIRDDPRVLIDNDPPPGTRVTITIRRVGELRDVTVQTVPHRVERRRFDPLYYSNLLFLLTALLTAWIVSLLRPNDKQAWLLALMLGTLTGLVGNDAANLPSWMSLVAGAAGVAGLLFFPVFVHFFLIFPDPSPLLRRCARLETWVYLPCLLVLLPVFGSRQLSATVGIWMLEWQWFRYVVLAALFVAIAYLIAGLACLVINYRAASFVARRKLRVVMAGSAAGFFNLLLLIMGGPTGLQERLPTLWSWFETTIYIALPLVPLSFVYAIVKHRVIPVSLIIRRSVRYLLVSRGAAVLGALVVGATITLLLTTIFTRLRPHPIVNGLVSAIVGIIAWTLFQRLHKRYLAPMIDRRFFRQAYDAQQIVADLTESLRTTTKLPRLLELAATRIQSALQTENVTIFLREIETGDYRSVYSCDYDAALRRVVSAPRDARLPGATAAIKQWFDKQWSDNGQPVEVELRNPPGVAAENPAADNGDGGNRNDGRSRNDGTGDSNVLPAADSERGNNQANEQGLRTLREIKATLLLPLATKEEVLGLIALGPRLGDLPFSGEDKDLLLSVAGPTTLAIENAQLVERMIAEARRRQELEAESERRARELEEARQLQLSMLPKSVPQLPQLEIAAYMKTATEVGGDYYDFHQADNGELTIAVGDATGHGLKAGTLVAATKSLFNHLASDPELTEILRHASRALKRMNLRGLFMALTMVKVDGHELRLSAAGMPPILLYRARTQMVEELLLIGVPLGSISGYRYRSHALRLEAGDVVLMMSDGFPERFNDAGEMLGYAPAKEALRASATGSAQAVIEQLITVGEAWAAGHPQDDDVTFVVLKIKAAGDGASLDR